MERTSRPEGSDLATGTMFDCSCVSDRVSSPRRSYYLHQLRHVPVQTMSCISVWVCRSKSAWHSGLTVNDLTRCRTIFRKRRMK